jgi:chromosome segregation ATPase
MAKSDLMEMNVDGDLSALDQLELKVERVTAVVIQLQEERRTLRSQLEKSEARIRELEASGGRLENAQAELAQWEEERSRWARERATVVLRLETILERLASVGIE